MGQRMPVWVNAGYAEYAKRLPTQCTLTLTEIPMLKRGKNLDLNRIQQQEGAKMLAAVPAGAYVIALHERGAAWNTLQLAEQLQHWQATHSHVALLVGAPEGLAPVCLQQAQHRWSLSPLTLPHPLVRIVLAEQLYRAWTVITQHPYHRA